MTPDKTGAAEEKKRYLGLLGLSMRAGKLAFGTDRVTDAVRAKRRAALVFLSAAASENTKKRVLNCCSYHGVPCRLIGENGEEIGRAIGRTGEISAVALLDKGFAKALSAYGVPPDQSAGEKRNIEGKAGKQA